MSAYIVRKYFSLCTAKEKSKLTLSMYKSEFQQYVLPSLTTSRQGGFPLCSMEWMVVNPGGFLSNSIENSSGHHLSVG